PWPSPSACIRLANFSGGGAILSMALFVSASSARSMNTAPGMWPASYSARGSRPASGMNFVASTTRRSDAPSSRSSHSVDTKASMSCSCYNLRGTLLIRPSAGHPAAALLFSGEDDQPMPPPALFQAYGRSASPVAAPQQKRDRSEPEG